NRGDSNAIANTLRSRGIAADVAPTAAKLGKQIKYADKLGIPYVWFPNENPENDGGDEVKNIITGDQRPADAQSWQPDTVYAQQTVSINADNR
ncbi:MAG: His/Gly/Thr/Pro-type tRNA ligase C-terminal domain-containing protein, partial [Bifidobacterium animalis]|nr:His/Gly/Thr/Pro-type tRNA ligase C-terminal domain-containing protein [Bifidobacterium animalis]